MNSEIIGSYLVSNSRILPVSEAGMLPSGSFRTIYEVIRVQSGVPLFLERHMERLENSARLMDCSIKTISDKIQRSVIELVKSNNSPDKNVKIIVYNLENTIPDYMAYFVQSSYPTSEEYKNGVLGILFKEERDNPNAKVVNSSFKERVATALSDAKAYEALLVNKNNEITEGSRSNIFFVNKDTVLTAPKGNVLIGITRVYVFELCKNLGIGIIEMPISVSMLKEMEGAFMTGTSPKILPINTIDNISYNSANNQVIKALMKGYDDIIAEYIREKTNW
jgi:branched-chain amino acid aminotransferase